ncbi:MAG: ATP-binding protein [Candidatus Magnetominusculus sp. LBB02]|nr:ATP-binding protein [Candidatus Magnetominusculus sp. LBB02]
MVAALLRIAVFFGVIIVSLAAFSGAEEGGKQEQAQAEPQRQHPRRPAPAEAVSACEGKKEGDSCTFKSPHGMLDGQCMAGLENIFACRPNRRLPEPTETTAKPQPAAVKQTAPASPSWRYAVLVIACVVSALAAALFVWFVFFRYVIMPLRRLRRVTEQLAEGNLSARVGEGLVSRGGEVAELGRDVDRMAVRIESLVGAHQRLIRDVSHELRSPLSRLNVALELARQQAGQSLSAPFDRIERESNRLNELISQLLMLTRLENDSAMIQKTSLDVAALIAEIAADVDFEARNTGRSVVVKAAQSPLMINGNRELLRQALENLLRNAVRYTADGTAVELSLRKRESVSRLWATIEIIDYGPGVPEPELKDIFRPFYRVNEAHERQSGGAGVGLAIADRAVLLHGGRLTARNTSGGTGLTMKMDLPLP